MACRLHIALFVTTVILTLETGAYVSNPPFYAQIYHGVGNARGLTVDDVGDILAKGSNSNNGVVAVFENDDGSIQRVDIVDGSGLQLNHGVQYANNYIYASSESTVYRWPYTSGQRQLITAPAEVLVRNIPGGGHTSRTLIVDAQGWLYVSCGSNSNVDQNSDRARIRRFSLDSVPNGGFPFNEGEVFADGLRNEVGLDFDSNGVLWGVENGADQANRPEFGDIHNGNPAEEMNKFDAPPGTHYGYPYCFSTYQLQGFEAGTQFAWDSFMTDGIHSDEWCRDPNNNKPPALAMPAHNAPLGITFYKGEGCDVEKGAFPCSAIGDAFVAFHGSWNSDIPVGYRAAWLTFNKQTGEPTGENTDVITDLRAVNAVFTKKGHLIVSTDTGNELVRITYGTPV